MSSGYEKADCGVDPNEGWGPSPSKAETTIMAIVAWMFGIICTIAPILTLIKLLTGSN